MNAINCLLNNSMIQSPRLKQNKTVFFFNSTSSFRQSKGELKGFKLKSLDEDKIHTLKTRYGQKANPQKPAFSEQQPLTQRPKIIYQNLRYRSFSKCLQPRKRQIVEQSDMIITSQSNSLPKQIKAREFPHFSSINLEGKMNQYLNLIIKKSHDSHKQKIRKMQQIEKQPRQAKMQNMYLIRMKMNQNRRKQSKDFSISDEQSRSMHSIEILNNIKQIIKKQSNAVIQDSKL